MIRFFEVGKHYPPAQTALADLSFEIERGEFVFLTGASGAGKSTLLKLIYREELPSVGQILVNGRSVASLPERKIPYLRRTIGIVFQSFRLIPRKTVFENVGYLPRIQGAGRGELERTVERALERVGLVGRERAYPRELSGGEQQRVALARAVVGEPEILLADEPTGNLDPRLSIEIVELLRSVRSELGTTIVMATHDHAAVRRFGGRVLTLSRGRLAADRSLEADPSQGVQESSDLAPNDAPGLSTTRDGASPDAVAADTRSDDQTGTEAER
ncbi:MAG: ATP-binding cassette domain-containing protein [Acidobacteria bacterium]|nr:MAG: ATP-binding cassette domain-containing protein [Acidobacteriota bacterium]REK03669.1 MAG: ATP-binding cassette domain-containing protein [Acidobacteriota bacterium]